MSTSERVRNLRLVLGDLVKPRNVSFQEAPGISGGIANGLVVELMGNARVEWLCAFLRIHPEYRVFWCEKDSSILPTALQQRGVSLERLTFGKFGSDMRKPIRQIITSQLFQVVVAPNLYTDINTFKAFQLLAEKGNSTLFLLGEKKPSTAWPIALQLQIGRRSFSDELNVEVIRQKHGLIS